MNDALTATLIAAFAVVTQLLREWLDRRRRRRGELRTRGSDADDS